MDMLGHLLLYKVSFSLENFLEFENIFFHIDLDKINFKVKNYKRISNGYDLIKFIKNPENSNKFKACMIDWTKYDNETKINCTLVLHQSEYKFIRVVNVELPHDIISQTQLKKYMELDVELYYNSNNFKSTKFPFSIKII